MESNDRQMMLIAYLEEDLDASQRALVEAWLEEDPGLAAEFQELARLDAHFARVGQQAWEDTGLDRIALYAPSQMQAAAPVEPVAVESLARIVNGVGLATHPGCSSESDTEILESAESGTPRRGLFARLVRTSHSWGLAAAVLLLGAVAAMSWFVAQQGTVKPEAARATDRVGHVLKSTDPALSVGSLVNAGQEIAVAEGRSVTVQGDHGAILWIDGGATVVFTSASRLSQQTGRVFYEVPSDAGIEVQNLSARNAQFELDLTDGTATRLAVRKGSVETPLGPLSAGQAADLQEPSLEKHVIDASSVGLWTGQFAPPNPPPGDRPSQEQRSHAPASLPREVGFFRKSDSDPGPLRIALPTEAEVRRLSAMLPPDTTGWVVIQDSGEFLRFLLREVDWSRPPLDFSIGAGQARIRSRELSKALELVPDRVFSAVLQPFSPRVSGPMVIALNNRRRSITVVANLESPVELMESIAAARGFEVVWYPQVQRGFRLGTSQLVRRQAFGGPRPYFRDLWIAASDDLLLISNQDDNPRRVMEGFGMTRLLGPLAAWEGQFVETPFFLSAERQRSPASEIFYALDLRPGIEALRAQSEAAATAIEHLGVAHWKSVMGTAELRPGQVEINAAFHPDEAASVAALNLFSQTSSHPFLSRVPAQTIALAAIRLVSLQEAYEMWRSLLREMSFGRDDLALERAEDELTVRLGFDPRHSLLPLLGPHVAVAVLSTGDHGTDWMMLWETDDADVLEEIVQHSLHRLEFPFATRQHLNVSYQMIVREDPEEPALMWRTTSDALYVGWGSPECFEQQIAAELGLVETLPETVAFRQWQRETDFTETSAFLYGDFSALYPKFLGAMLAILEPDRGAEALAPGARIPMFLALRPDGDRLALNGVFLMGADNFLSAAQFWRVPALVEEELRKRVRLTENNLRSIRDWVREYHRRQGILPESLEDLRRLGIGYPLNDPFSSEQSMPFHYARDSESTWRVWSLGPNGLDEEGKLGYDEEHGLQSAGDIIARGSLAEVPADEGTAPRAP